MRCFDCGVDGPYMAESCHACGRLLRVAPPHLHPNHVSQVQVAIQEFMDGQLGDEELLQVFAYFEEGVAHFEEHWGPLLERLMKDRLGEEMRPHFLSACVEFDRALVHLSEALTLVQEFRQGQSDTLPQIQIELTDFFHIACGGVAIALHELELEQIRQQKLGAAADVAL